ncbi:hypothetical protein C8R46DRAFT_1287263 [Mycena filopes]|nr:hypothetical protein C8R46DRAFT_1287263 [Mycena filopes]
MTRSPRFGSTLRIYFKPEVQSSPLDDPSALRDQEESAELSPDWTNGFIPLTVAITRSFTPFTNAVVLLVEALNQAEIPLATRFILKLCDRRFGKFGYRHPDGEGRPWQPEVEERLRDEVSTLIGPDRSHRIPDQFYERIPNGREDWEVDLYTWAMKKTAYLSETLVHRHLRSLQGDCIPRLCRTVRHPISVGRPFLHPSVDFVHGLAIEHIPGPTIADLKVGVDISKEQAEVVSERLIDDVTRIRDLRCQHDDIRPRNFVLRNWPQDPSPRAVIIDFGCAYVVRPGESKSALSFDDVKGLRYRLGFQENTWHIASPYPQHVWEGVARDYGYEYANDTIEETPEEERSRHFERLSVDPETRDKMLQ